MYRNKLSLQQDARLHLQRDALQKRQAELQSVDQRILELQGRLNKKRSSHVILNHSNSNNNAGNHVRSVSSNASLEGELELVKITASQVSNPSAANDEGITALHNAICAGHVEIVK
ncbi:hypothetical protein pipiens_014755 [Culex pipiens pipiens]|uniref:Apoptosis stimulating of P53 n=1 Tax=Culex pipiens pipiens TaxID=38569 RepID=A0ABD1CTB6_CULPP